jgi:kynurenine 3-monooxygenase
MNKKTQTHNKNVTIIGSGLGGCFLAVLLANRGYTIDLYEKLSRQQISDTNSKRSYNITFRTHGINMLKKAGVWDALTPHLLPLKGSSTQLSKNAKPIVSLIQDTNEQYLAVSRSDLLAVLLKKLTDQPSVSLHYETTLLSIDRRDKTITVKNEKSKKVTIVETNVVIGADGANSSVRLFLQLGQHTTHSQEYSPGGYKQFSITKEQVQQLNLRNDIAYNWVAGDKFILAFPNLDGSLASLLIYPKDKNVFDLLKTQKSLEDVITDNFPHLHPIQKDIASQLLENPTGRFVTIHTDPWYYKDFVTLMGDAAHGFYPFFGQGTTAAFGDAMKLVELVDEHGPDWEKIFPLYQEARKRHMDALGELSKDALMRYMRSKRADARFIYDELEAVGHSILPKFVKPPVSHQVMENPDFTADYVAENKQQRKRANTIGVSLAVALLTGMVALYELKQKSRVKES